MMTPSNAILKIPNASPCPALHNENSSYSNVNLGMIRKTAIAVACNRYIRYESIFAVCI
jgi:hypothetical protein